MTDELREALERAFPIYSMGGLSAAMYPADENTEGEGWAMDNADFRLVADAARAHLGCSTITDEMVEAAAKAMVERGGWVIWEATSEPLKDAARTDARAALEAARVVHRED
jgi:hypothetical protein